MRRALTLGRNALGVGLIAAGMLAGIAAELARELRIERGSMDKWNKWREEIARIHEVRYLEWLGYGPRHTAKPGHHPNTCPACMASSDWPASA